jgi:hypothetical protein
MIVSALKIWAAKNLLLRRTGVCANLVNPVSQSRAMNLVNAWRGIDMHMLNSSAPMRCSHQINRILVVIAFIR